MAEDEDFMKRKSTSTATGRKRGTSFANDVPGGAFPSGRRCGEGAALDEPVCSIPEVEPSRRALLGTADHRPA